jgi:tRNA pseudouridine55 synthase
MFGLLNVDKPSGWTSRDVVNRIARLVPRGTKVGHAGTLDPLATGVLVVCVGAATRLEPWIHDHLKAYDATFLLGKSSPTDDIEGELTSVALPESITADAIRHGCSRFIGHVEQVPPAYSAIKVNGKRAYALARQGAEVQLTARPVYIAQIELDRCVLPEIQLQIECGSGTYIRSIGRDLARDLGTEAVMSALRRTRVGPFHQSEAVPLESLTRENLAGALRPPEEMLQHLTSIVITPQEHQRLAWGQTLLCRDDWNVPSDQDVVIMTEDRTFTGIATVSHQQLKSRLILPPAG